MKRILILSMLLHIGIMAEAQDVKKLQPLSVFNGDRKVYLEKNFGQKGYPYSNQKISIMVNDIEIPFKSIHFQLREMGDGKYQVPVIRLFFDEMEVVDEIIKSGRGNIDNITIRTLPDEYDKNAEKLSDIISGRSESFLVPLNQDILKKISELNISNSYFTTEYP